MVINWWWALALVTFLCIVLAFVYSTVTKSTVYTARATILVQDSRSASSPTLGNIGGSRELATTYKELITTPRLLEMVRNELNIPLDDESIPTKVSVSIRPGTALLDVEVQGTDPDVPANYANELILLFIHDRQTARLANIARLEALATAQGTTDTSALVAAQLSTLGSMSLENKAINATSSTQPSTRKNVVLAGIVGLFLGGLLVFFLDFAGNKIKSVDQIDKLFQLNNVSPSIMGVVFQWPPKDFPEDTLIVHQSPDSIYSEMFRQVRTGFQFTTVANPGKSFLITSVGPREGKSTIISNLGAALAQGGAKVIIVDSDLRRPTLHRLFGLDRRGAEA